MPVNLLHFYSFFLSLAVLEVFNFTALVKTCSSFFVAFNFINRIVLENDKDIQKRTV